MAHEQKSTNLLLEFKDNKRVVKQLEKLAYDFYEESKKNKEATTSKVLLNERPVFPTNNAETSFKNVSKNRHTTDDKPAQKLHQLSLNDQPVTYSFETNDSNSNASSNDTNSDIMLNEHKLGIKQFDRYNLEFVKKLGKGNFGTVYQFKVKDHSLIQNEFVAVKKIDKYMNDDREIENFSKCEHENIVKFIGYYEDDLSNYIVMEFMSDGNLSEYLLDYENKFNIGQAFGMLLQVADGMSYLHKNRIIHRDLAARNCMIIKTQNSLLVKISDFGLSRMLYEKDYYRQGEKTTFSYVWTALECLNGDSFTKGSDVWSFGILMWEVFARINPWLKSHNFESIKFVLSKNQRLKGPNDACSPKTYDLMKSCWFESVENRPTFKDLWIQMQTILFDIDNEVDKNQPSNSNNVSLVYTKSTLVEKSNIDIKTGLYA